MENAGSFGIDKCDDNNGEKSMSRLKRGDLSALEKLYTALGRPVFLFVLSIVGDYCAAEDITQDTFLKVNGNAAGYRSGTNLKAWVFTIAHNLAVSYIRARGREINSDIKPAGPAQDVEDSAIGKADFTCAIKSLEGEERSVVVMRIAAGLRYSEISKITGLSAGNARVIYSRAIKKLRKYYSCIDGR